MLVTKPYVRENAVAYAKKYAFSQNSLFGNFAGIGGNCTNFVSQSIYAGSCEMNYTPTFGWYFISLDDRSPSWTGVEFLYDFLISNRTRGVYGTEVNAEDTKIGDVIQLGNNNRFYHSLLIVAKERREIYVAAHDNDAWYRPLYSYEAARKRYIHIEGYYIEQ